MKQTLVERRTELLAKIAAPVVVDLDGDETDEIQGKTIAAIHNQIASRDRERVARIDRALFKMEEGTFGACEECEEPIEEKRIQFNPEFSTCFQCAENKELRNKLKRIRGTAF